MKSFFKSTIALVVFIASTAGAGAQLSQEDVAAGWVDLIKPDFEGLYSFVFEEGKSDTVHRNIFSVTKENEILVQPDQFGHIGTKKEYSHYRMRVEFKFGTRGPGAWGTNAGLMYHIDESAPYMAGKWPQSIEAQCLTTNLGAAISIQEVTFDMFSKPEGKPQFLPESQGGILKTCPTAKREFRPSKDLYKEGEWNLYEIIVNGSDKAQHFINGELVMEISHIRHDGKPYGKGHVALQAEKKEIWYRNWHLLELEGDAK